MRCTNLGEITQIISFDNRGSRKPCISFSRQLLRTEVTAVERKEDVSLSGLKCSLETRSGHIPT